MAHGCADAVGIRVRGDQQVDARLLAERQAALKRPARLGIGIRTGREIAVGHRLLLDERHVGHADALEDARDAFEARSVQGRIHDAQGAARIGDRLRGDGIDERIHDRVVDPRDEARAHGVVEIHAAHVVEGIDRVDGCGDVGCGLRSDLAAVRAVDLVAVIGRGIMARRHVDACRTAQTAHREGKRRRRLDAREHERADAVGRQDAGDAADEGFSPVAGIARNGNRRRVEAFVQVACKPLRRAADGIDVHAVRADAQDAAQPGRSERKIPIEGICQILGRFPPHVGKVAGKFGVFHAARP